MRPRTPLAILAALPLLASGCADRTGPTSAEPGAPNLIINGTPTGRNTYASVGALLFDFNRDAVINGDDEWCTGSLIAPTVFLTAAHCVISSSTPPGTRFYVSFSDDLYAKSFRYIKATGYVYDPLYGHDMGDLHDLAVVFLPSGSTRGMTVYQLPPKGLLDQLAAQGELNGAIFINVGYGTANTRTGVPAFPYDGLRKMSESEFMALQPAWLGLNMNINATGLGGDCYGDSGGPKFLKGGDPDMIFATVTTGDYPCRATSWDYRLDTPEARALLGRFVNLP